MGVCDYLLCRCGSRNNILQRLPKKGPQMNELSQLILLVSKYKKLIIGNKRELDQMFYLFSFMLAYVVSCVQICE